MVDTGTHSVIPIRRMAPEDWQRGFTMKKFMLANRRLVPVYALSEDISKSVERTRTRKPVARCPSPHPPKVDLKETLKKATDTQVKLEPERREYKKMKILRPGLGKPKTALERAMVRQMNEMGRVYVLSDVDLMCYEDGVREWLEKAKRKTARVLGKATRWVKREALPTIARSVTLGLAGAAHTELGLPPTTVDLLPVQRTGLKRDLQPYPSMRLRAVVQDLQHRLVSETDPALQKVLQKGLADIVTELEVRRALVMHP